MSWPEVPLADVATIDRFGIDPAEVEADTAYLGLEHIARGGEILGAQATGEAALASTKFRFTREHILFGKLRPNLGKVALPDFDGICSTDLLPIRPGPKLDRSYLRYYLALPSMVEFAASRAAGANLPRLSPSVLATFLIPLPPLDEQRRIAAILDQADALRAKRRQALAHLDNLTRSIFLDMFGGAGEDFAYVGDISAPDKGSIRTGPFGSQLLHSEFVKDGVAVLGIDNVVRNHFVWAERRYITSEKFEQLRRYTVTPGDVLITIMGTCGRCVVVPDEIPPAINTKHLCAITVDRSRLIPQFLRACFLWHPESRRFLEKRAKGSIMSGLNMGIIKEMPLPVPPLAQQAVFADRAEGVDARLSSQDGSAQRFGGLFTSLQSRAFSGQL